MPDHIEIIIRSFLAFSILLIGTRLLGKQTISQMNVLNFIVAISIGAMTANIAFNLAVKIHHLVLAFSIFVSVSIFMAFISLKSVKARNWLIGNPTIVIEKGQILNHNMKKARYTIDELNQLLREKNIFNIEEIEYAIIETNGKLSILKKQEHEFMTKKDGHIFTSENQLPIELVMDGKLMVRNFNENQLSKTWFEEELIKRKLSEDEVFYAVLSASRILYINTYSDRIDQPSDIE